jgi:integrase
MSRRRKGTGSIQERAGGGYRVRLTLPDGERVSRGATTLEAARALLLALRVEATALVAAGAYEAPEEATLASWGATWMERREARVAAPVKDRSRWRCYVCGSVLAQMPLRSIRSTDVREWLDGLEMRDAKHGKQLSAQTVAHALNLVRRCLADARARGLIETNPAAGLSPDRKDPKRERAFLSLPELRRVVESDAVPLRARCCYVFALFTGLRPGELWALRWRDIDTGGPRPEVHVRRSHARATTKTGEPRNVPLLPGALLALGTLRVMDDYSCDADDLVFPTVTGRQRLESDDHGWSSRTVRRDARVGHRELAGVRREVDFYGLRHGCASLLVMGELTGAPVPIPVVQRFLGHANVSTTMRYAHLAPDFLHSIIRPPTAC